MIRERWGKRKYGYGDIVINYIYEGQCSGLPDVPTDIPYGMFGVCGYVLKGLGDRGGNTRNKPV